jgi:hypothetical protein
MVPKSGNGNIFSINENYINNINIDKKDEKTIDLPTAGK